jgi:hypothetical protein
MADDLIRKIERTLTGLVLSSTGRPILGNPDGSSSTELSITVTDPRLNGGMPTNIPSIWQGHELDEDGAVLMAIQSGQKFGAFKSVDEAVKAAKARSSTLSGELRGVGR